MVAQAELRVLRLIAASLGEDGEVQGQRGSEEHRPAGVVLNGVVGEWVQQDGQAASVDHHVRHDLAEVLDGRPDLKKYTRNPWVSISSKPAK